MNEKQEEQEKPEEWGPGTNTGHGYVWERPDGSLVRCGGPGLCSKCRADQERLAQS